MKARTMAHLRREPTPHTEWCARDHRCVGDVHRAPDLRADEIGGRAWLSRVRAADVEYVEIRARIPLHRSETGARWQITAALAGMRLLLARIALRPGVITNHPPRPAIDRRNAA